MRLERCANCPSSPLIPNKNKIKQKGYRAIKTTSDLTESKLKGHYGKCKTDDNGKVGKGNVVPIPMTEA